MGMGFMPASPSCVERASCDCERCGDGERDGGKNPVPLGGEAGGKGGRGHRRDAPYRGDRGDLPPGAARERRGVGEDVFGRPGDKEHGEHDRFEPRRIFEPWDGPHLLAGEEQPDEPRAQGLHERYDGERSSECARKAKGGPLPESEQVARRELDRLSWQDGDSAG